MEIDKGEFFSITRGYERGQIPGGYFSSFFGSPQTETKPSYDRSYDGWIFEAVEVCGPMISAKVIFQANRGPNYDYVGQVKCVNTTELEVMTVTKQFVDSIIGAVHAP